jgi:GTP-binding protein
MNPPRSILVLQLRRVGDVLFTLPAAGVLRRQFPRARIEELEESITAALGARHFEKQHASSNDVPRIAIIGKPNVGKSSIVNALMSAPKRATSPLLVSSIPGTTRDATDTEIKADGATFIFTDTAGLKKNQKNDQDIERFAAMRTVSAVEQSDVVVLVIDATEGVKRQDKRIAALAIESGKSLVILINKIDLFIMTTFWT